MRSLPRSAGYSCLLVIQNLFTKWIEVKTNEKLIREALENLVINLWEALRILITDNGTKFVNKVIKDFAEQYQITHRTMPPYNVQANTVERVNRTGKSLKTMIVVYLERDHRNWDLRLKEFRFAYNTAHHSSFGTTPAFLNLGRDLEPAYAICGKGRDDANTPAGDAVM